MPAIAPEPAAPAVATALPLDANAAVDPNGDASPARIAYWRQGIAEAVSFVKQSIADDLLPAVDKDNNTFYEARDANAVVVGYVRDFVGPVSPAEECACSPLNLTLVFNQDQTLRTLLAPAPLQKRNHASMTPAEQERLVALARTPPPALMAVNRVEDMIDATTGATRRELAEVVVPQAAYSTRRIAGLVRDTRRILRGGPVSRDRLRLQQIMQQEKDPRPLAQAVASFLPTAESDELRLHAYRVMTGAYSQALSLQAQAADTAVEERLLNPGLSTDVEPNAILAACYGLFEHGLRLPLAERCISRLQGKVDPDQISLLRGTASFLKGDVAAALSDLQAAARSIPAKADANLHLRLARALRAQNRGSEACRVARAVFVIHPLLPEAREALTACTTPTRKLDAVVAELMADSRSKVLSREIVTALQIPAIAVTDDADAGVDLPLSDPNQVTVLVFFATWCPHCRAELPRIKNFVAGLGNHPAWQKKVRVAGVRTAVERENEPFDDFMQKFALNFPVYSDSTMSMAFAAFAKAAGIPLNLPTVAVIDAQNRVRFFLEPGDDRDTQTELGWVVERALTPPAGKSIKR